MRRRTLLGALGAGASSLSGCLVFDGERSPEELPPVTVEYAWHSGLSPVGRVGVRATEDELTYEIRCRREDADGGEATASLSDEDYTALQRLVVRSEPGSWKERYDCADVCADDDGMRSLRATVDGTAHETSIDPMADPPARVQRLVEQMRAFQDRFDRPRCR